jgi:ABC-type Na+ efflux pump permease subunit
MSNITTVLRKELKCFAGSDKGTFFLYALLSVIWSFALLSGTGTTGAASAPSDPFGTDRLWLVFFSVIVTGNFSNTVFISERVTGTLEILITSGLPRSSVLYGKMAFVILMTSVIGAACAALAFLWSALPIGLDFPRPLGISDALAYLSVTYLSAAASAYLSVRMANPRFLHFVNLFMIGGIMAACVAAGAFFDAHPSIFIVAFLLAGGIFTLLAKREFEGERIIRPVIF